MNALIPFDFEGRTVRSQMDAAGIAWFIARDVCDCLGLQNASKAVERLDENETANITIGDTSSNGVSQNRSMLAITEPGVYKLCFTSRKDEAKRFTRWLTHEVLPTLRQTGSYTMPGVPPISPALPTGPGPSFSADRMVGAARTLTALLRAGRAMGMSRPRATHAANSATLRATGIDLAAEMDYIAGPDEPGNARQTVAEMSLDVRCGIVLDILKRGAVRGRAYTRRDIARYWRGWDRLDPDEQEAILAELVRSGEAVACIRGGARGRKSEAFMARKFAEREAA